MSSAIKYTQIKILRGTPEETEELAKLAARTFYNAHAPIVSPQDCRAYMEAAFTLETQERELSDPKNVFFTAWAGRTLAGYAKLKDAAPDRPVGEKPVCLQRLYLDDQWFGHGIGARLMEKCVKEAVRHGFKTMWLQVHVKNDRAVTFYKKWGFTTVGLCDFCCGQSRNPNYLMALGL